jgi:hypothetical protein
MKALERKHLEAEMAAVQALLVGRTEESDPIGWAHFRERLVEIQEQLSRLAEEAETTLQPQYFWRAPCSRKSGHSGCVWWQSIGGI